MGMDGYLCALSAARAAQLDARPGQLLDVFGLRDGEAVGVLDLGKAWDALDIILSDRGDDSLLGDAVLARSGKPMKAAGAYGPASFLLPSRVARIAAALGKVPARRVRDRYGELYGKNVHGGYGQEVCASDEIKYIREKVAAIQRAFDGFELWGGIRSVVQTLAFVANVWALVKVASATS